MSKVVYRYAKAFYEESVEKNVTEEVVRDMQLLRHTLMQNLNLQEMLLNPSLSNENKCRVLKEIFTRHFNPQTIVFVGFLADKKRLSILGSIAEQLEKISKQEKGLVTLKITLSPGLDDGFVNRLTEKIRKIANCQFEVKTIIDDSLMGGFIYEYQGIVYDCSVRGRLNSLQKKLIS